MSNKRPQQTFEQYKIREIVKGKNITAFGITIPTEIANKFEGIKFTITVEQNSIILHSGQDIAQLRKEMR